MPTLGTQRAWAPPRRGIRYGLPEYAQPPASPPIPPPLPSPPTQQQWVLGRGIINRVAAARMQPPAILWATHYATGTLIFGGASYDFLSQLGSPPQQQQAWTLQRGVMNRVQAAAMRPPPIRWATDLATGTLVFGGSSSESKAGSDAQAGTFTFTGSRVEAVTFSGSSGGQILFGGSSVESNSHPPVILPSPRSTQTFTAPD